MGRDRAGGHPARQSQVLSHFLEFGRHTYPGPYQHALASGLPDDIRQVGLLVRKNVIHRTTLAAGNTGTNADLRYGDMADVPWWRQPEDDVLVTASAMLSELYRRDSRGLVPDRRPANKLVVTCRHVTVLMTAILRSKGIPARSRAGFSHQGPPGPLGAVAGDHWVNEYWDSDGNRWVRIDVDGSLGFEPPLDPYDLTDGVFEAAADAWLAIREGRVDPLIYVSAHPARGSVTVLWSLFCDFHSLMNDEILYFHVPVFATSADFPMLTASQLERIDALARLMRHPDDHFSELLRLWETEREFRIVTGGLL